MATIEPRLIHLLNESTTPQLPHTDLPPFHALPLPAHSDLPLPPLEPDSSHRAERTGAEGHVQTNGVSLPLRGGDDNYTSRKNDDSRGDGNQSSVATVYPVRLLLAETDAPDYSRSLNKILDDATDAWDDGSHKKRTRGLTVKDDFLQLPQPIKKQKAAPQAPVMPPIINGLHEPPPHAALFPPISSSSFQDNDATQLKLLEEFTHSPEDRSAAQSAAEADKSPSKARKRATKPRRKWSEEETNHLLLGVDRHGVGKWTTILEDSDFNFNDRTAGDLKDRFRTCCPAELRAANRGALLESPPPRTRGSKKKAKKGIHSENILIEEEEESPSEAPLAESPQNESESTPKHRKSRAHRKKMEDLAELGIHGPFKKSHRRERRPFTDQEDREILEGLERYGPAWTKIQRDERFHLSSRRPTDLRDRLRNKYNAVYQRMEKAHLQTKDGSRGNDVMEPSIIMSIDNTLKRSNPATTDPQMNRAKSKEDPPRWPFPSADSTDISQPLPGFEFGETSAPHFMGGEMDISRLLLDDTRLG